MTPSPQSSCTSGEQEYRITESQMLQIESMFHQPDWTLDDEDEKSRADLLIGIRFRPIAAATPFVLPKDTTNLECINEGLIALSDYFNAALEGEENKKALRRMWDRQMGILFSLLSHCSNDTAIRRGAYEQGAREERERIIDLLLPIFAEDNRSPFELEGCPNCDRTIRMYLESLRSGK